MAGRFVAFVAVVAAVLVGAFWIITRPAETASGGLPERAPDLENGRRVFFAGGCAACHATPNQEERTRLGGGLALKSPFGTFFVPNISSDPRDGIGAWSEAQFLAAMVKGVSPAGEHLYPAFPYAAYQRARQDDLRDLFAFLKTLPPVAGRPPDHDLRFPFSVRRAIGLWKWLYLDGKPFVPDPNRSPEWNRGAYLVESLAHCAECHSGRDPLGGINPGQRFAGGPNPEGEGWVPNITQASLREWTVDDIRELLSSGMTREGETVGGSMRAVVRNMAELPEADRRAIAVYIKSLPPAVGPAPPQ
ncbi:MAG TPA: cytochrome c [Xanthobacteraceae bacterium]|nr:cytochrome c [Xanthobacteraceae bacterium]